MKAYVLYANGLRADTIIAKTDKDAVWSLCPKWDFKDKNLALYCDDDLNTYNVKRNYILKLIK